MTPFTQHLEMPFWRQRTLVAAGVSNGGRFAVSGRKVVCIKDQLKEST